MSRENLQLSLCYGGCSQLVKLKDFDNHALKDEGNPHSLIIGNNNNHTIMFTCKILENNVVYVFRHYWTMGCIQALDELFHVGLAYHNQSKCFVFSIWLAKNQNIASKYRANLFIEGDNSELCFNGIKVSSVANAPAIYKCIEDTESIFLCLPRHLAKNITVKKQEGSLITESLNVAVTFKKI